MKRSFRVFFDEHGHLNVPQSEPVIGNLMATMRHKGIWRAEFDESFPGMFVAASRDHKWEVLEALFRAFYTEHGRAWIPSRRP